MPWSGIWFEHDADAGKARSTEYLRGLVEPRVYPFARNFIEGEEKRLRSAKDPGSTRRPEGLFQVYYSLNHDGGQSGVDQQGCRILRWLFNNFSADGDNPVAARFSEIPVVIHEPHPARAAALGNALTLLRFLGAAPDQAVARILLHPWRPLRGGPHLAAQDYERRVIEFLHGGIFYPEEVDLFDVLDRSDLRRHRELAPCCRTQIGFIGPLLEWVDDCWPKTPEERADLRAKLKNSLADEASYQRRALTRGAASRGD